MTLADKVVWITGASRGIGQGIALTCAREGAQTVLVAREYDHLLQTDEIIRAEKLHAPIKMAYDITDAHECGMAFSEVFKKTKRLDVLVNNAGIMQDALLGMITSAQVESTFAVNVFSSIYHMQYAARLMSKNKNGSIINVSSIIGCVGNAGQTVYGASKAALIGATYLAAKELASQRILVNAIAPGFIDTDLAKQLSPEKFQQKLDLVAMKRIGTPDDIARAVLFLGSDMSEYITGQVLGVAGGMLV